MKPPTSSKDRPQKLRVSREASKPLRTAGIVSPPDPKTLWTIHVQGRCTEVRRVLCNFTTFKQTSRGVPGMLSQQSRMRLLKLINRIDHDKYFYNLFVTVTYPPNGNYSDHKERSKHRYLFMRSVESHLGRPCPSLWRQEWKVRQSGDDYGCLVPHFHLMIFGVQFIPHRKINQWWKTASGASGYVRTDVRRVQGSESAGRYLAKYVSKPDASLVISAYRNNPSFGRAWGITRPELIPFHPVLADRQLTDAEIDFLKSLQSERSLNYDEFDGGGFTVFSPEFAADVADFLGLPLTNPPTTS